MPRKARSTTSGAPAQPAVAPKGQTYGSGEAALESQRRSPIPNVVAQQQAATSAGGGGGGGAMTPDVMAQVQDYVQAMGGGRSVLAQPTARPNEPVQQPLGPTQNFKRPQVNEGIYELRALAAKFPYPDLLAFLDRVEREA